MPIKEKDITIIDFLRLFKKIVEEKEKAGIRAIQNNPKDLFKRAQSYGIRYKKSIRLWISKTAFNSQARPLRRVGFKLQQILTLNS